MSSKHMLYRNRKMQLYEGFKIKWLEMKKDNNGNECKEELENYGCKTSCIDGVQSFVDLQIK